VRGAAPAGAERAGMDVEAHPARGAERPVHAVAVAAVDARAEIEVVRVLVDDLDRLVRPAVQHRMERIAELEERLESVSDEAHQEAVALGAVERIRGRARIRDELPDVLERVAEPVPHGAREHLRAQIVGQAQPSAFTPHRSV
jgi:hypothetical protein